MISQSRAALITAETPTSKYLQIPALLVFRSRRLKARGNGHIDAERLRDLSHGIVTEEIVSNWIDRENGSPRLLEEFERRGWKPRPSS